MSIIIHRLSRKLSLLGQQLPSVYASAMSTSHLNVQEDAQLGIATVTMNKLPVNSMDTAFMKEITSTIATLEANQDCRCLILTSASNKVFSAGLDLPGLYQPGESQLREKWTALQDCWLHLYNSRLVTLTAITGHALAGGCMLALATDFRIMTKGKFKIGLNEVALGLPLPFWLKWNYQQVITHRYAELYGCRGDVFSPEEALTVGMVDKLVDDADNLLPETVNEASKFLTHSSKAVSATKQGYRSPLVQSFHKIRKKELDTIVEIITGDSFQKVLNDYLTSLKKSKN